MVHHLGDLVDNFLHDVVELLERLLRLTLLHSAADADLLGDVSLLEAAPGGAFGHLRVHQLLVAHEVEVGVDQILLMAQCFVAHPGPLRRASYRDLSGLRGRVSLQTLRISAWAFFEIMDLALNLIR